jgi:hypothetical protein
LAAQWILRQREKEVNQREIEGWAVTIRHEMAHGSNSVRKGSGI